MTTAELHREDSERKPFDGHVPLDFRRPHADSKAALRAMFAEAWRNTAALPIESSPSKPKRGRQT
jgi:hypothetical protein